MFKKQHVYLPDELMFFIAVRKAETLFEALKSCLHAPQEWGAFERVPSA